MLRNHLQFGPVPFKQRKFSQENRQECKLLMNVCSRVTCAGRLPAPLPGTEGFPPLAKKEDSKENQALKIQTIYVWVVWPVLHENLTSR